MCEIDYSEGGGRRITSGKARSLRNPELINVRLSNMVPLELAGLNRAPTPGKSCSTNIKTYPSAVANSLLGPQWADGTSELGLVELAGIEPATS